MNEDRSDEPVAVEVELVPQPHGGALQRGGSPGRPRTSTGMLQFMARTKLDGAIKLAGEIVKDKEQSIEDRMRAAEFLRRCTGMDREKPRVRKRSTFSVVTASADEQATKVSDRTAPAEPEPAIEIPPAPAEPKSGDGAPR